MRFSGRKAKIIIILLALLVAGEVYLLFVRSDIGWRAKVIAQKTIGGIPELTWSQTFAVIIPPFLYGEDGAYRTEFITRVKVEGAGSVSGSMEDADRRDLGKTGR